MSVGADMEELIDLIQHVGLEPSRWPAAIQRLSDSFRASASGMWLYRPGDPSWSFSVHLGVTPEYLTRFQRDFTVKDNWCEEAMRPAPAGSVAADWMLVPLPKLRASALFQEWGRPQGLYAAAIVKTAMDRDGMGLLSLLRSEAAGEWETNDISRLRALAPHLVRATQVSRKLGGLMARADLAEEALDLAPQPLMILDREARLIHGNCAAFDLLRREDGLRLHHGSLYASDASSSKRLRGLISRVATTASGDAQLVIRRCNNQRPLLLHATRMRSSRDPWAPPAQRVILIISHSEAPRHDGTTFLVDGYGLTPAEARLASLITEKTPSLREAADQLGISLNTAKTHLRKIFLKTGTRRQSELAILISRVTSRSAALAEGAERCG